MELRKHKVTSSEQVQCPKTGHAEAITRDERCNGCNTTLTADNADQYGLLTLSTNLGRMLGL